MSPELESFRYEKKVFLENFQYVLLNYVVSTSSFNFYKPYESRWVNNIYFDDYNFSAFKDNIEGNRSRKKLRIRWYGQQLENPNTKKLELKMKKGHVGAKEYFDLGNFYVGKKSNAKSIMTQIKNCDLDKKVLNSLSSMRPIISNRYQRDYYLSMNGRIRITIDRDISFENWFYPSGEKNKLLLDNACILEIKFSKESLEDAKTVFQTLGVRSTKSSKYVMAVDSLIAKGFI